MMHLYNISVDGPPGAVEEIMRALEGVGCDSITISDEGPSEIRG